MENLDALQSPPSQARIRACTRKRAMSCTVQNVRFERNRVKLLTKNIELHNSPATSAFIRCHTYQDEWVSNRLPYPTDRSPDRAPEVRSVLYLFGDHCGPVLSTDLHWWTVRRYWDSMLFTHRMEESRLLSSGAVAHRGASWRHAFFCPSIEGRKQQGDNRATGFLQTFPTSSPPPAPPRDDAGRDEIEIDRRRWWKPPPGSRSRPTSSLKCDNATTAR